MRHASEPEVLLGFFIFGNCPEKNPETPFIRSSRVSELSTVRLFNKLLSLTHSRRVLSDQDQTSVR